MNAIDASELTRAVQQVFGSMLGLQLSSCNGDRPPDFPPGRKVSATVGISGEWNGAVVLECGTGTACHLTGIMMGSSPPPSVDEAVKDVVGELTNMIAGTFKTCLPGNSTLTLPCIIEGSDYSMDIIQGQRVVTQPMTCEGKGIVLSVIKANGRY